MSLATAAQFTLRSYGVVGISRPVPPGLPSVDDELLLRAALLAGPAAGEAWAAWSAHGRLDRSGMNERRLLPAVYLNLADQRIDHPELGRLRGIHRHDWYQSKLLSAAAARLTEALDGVPTVMLGHEVLVPQERAASAVGLAEKAGWLPEPPGDVLSVRHAWSFRRSEDLVTLRWRALPYSRADERDLWDAATGALCPADELLVTCTEGLTSNAGPKWVVDALALIPLVDCDRFCATATRHRLTCTAVAALQYLRATFTAPIPASVLERLQAVPVSRAERRLHHALLGRPHRVRRGLVIHWAAYRALAPPIDFPIFLLGRLGVDRVAAVPGFAAVRIAERYRARRRRSAALATRV
jgi:hypothetical protein